LSTALGSGGTVVSPICNLLYRRFEIGRVSDNSSAFVLTGGLRNAIPRYGRLKICATNFGLSRPGRFAGAKAAINRAHSKRWRDFLAAPPRREACSVQMSQHKLALSGIRNSDFPRISGFEFRISSFGFAPLSGARFTQEDFDG
jgi:hypothetical protein